MIRKIGPLFLIFTITSTFAQTPKAAVNFTSSNLPIVLINTNGQPIINEAYRTAMMGVIDYGVGATNRMTDLVNGYDDTIAIKTRGSWTLSYPQKSYSIKTVDGAGFDSNFRVMGMNSEHKWVLYAPYDDYTFMSNPLAFQISREMGSWAPRTRFCEVMLDTGFGYDYNGIYVMMEKIKRDNDRVNIARLDADDNAGDSLSGGYIIAVDQNINDANPAGFQTSNSPSLFITYKYPDGNSITAPQKQYIASYIDSVETSLLASNFTDPDEGYRKYIDEYSFIDFFIIQELSKNLDGFKRSAYLYKNKFSKGGKLFAGPQWDFNAGFGNSKFTESFLGVCDYDLPTGWVHMNKTCWIHTIAASFPVPFWWERLLEDPEFEHHLKCRWMQLRQTVLSKPHINSLIDSMQTLATAASARQYTRYDFSYNYSDQVDYLKTWISDRIDWMDANMPGTCIDINIGIDENDTFEKLFTISPNPTSDIINLFMDLNKEENLTVTIVDALGREVSVIAQQKYSFGNHQLTIPPENYTPGLYFVKIQSESSYTVKKVLVSKN